MLAVDQLDVHTYDINTPIEFHKVLMVGSKDETIIGRPYLQVLCLLSVLKTSFIFENVLREPKYKELLRNMYKERR